MRSLTIILILGITAAAQAQVPTTTLLQRCTSVPDVDACRSVLRRHITPRQKSIALTYIEESEDFPSDSMLKVAIRYDSTNALAHYLLGRTSGGSIGIKHMMIAQRLRPEWTFIPRQMAERFGQIGTTPVDTVTMLWQRLAELEPTNAATVATYGLSMLWSKPNDAIPIFRRALQLDPNEPRATGGLCMALLNAKQGAAARDVCPRGIAGYGTYPGIELYNLAGAAFDLKEYEIALQATERGLASDLMSATYRRDKVRILEAMGRTPEAERFMQDFVLKYPGDYDALNDLGDMLFFENRLTEAREVYQKLLSIPCTPQFIVIDEVRKRVAEIDAKLKTVK